MAVLWEPDVSLALEHPGVKKLLGSEDTERLIVDILVVRRQFAQENPKLIQEFLRAYFRVLKKYRDQPTLLEKHLRKKTGLDEDRIRTMLNGVQWSTFMDNCEKWFGIGPPQGAVRDMIIDTIDSTVEVLISANDFSASPVPDNDPYRITNSTFLQKLFTGGMSGFQVAGSTGAVSTTDSLTAPFPPLDQTGWATLREVGTLKVEPIIFQQGAATLNLMAHQVIDKAMERLTHYPNFRITIKGHTGTRGNEQANIHLSQARADAVKEYMISAFRINSDRLQALGFGSAKPLGRKAGEPLRAYEYRLPRVELALVREEI